MNQLKSIWDRALQWLGTGIGIVAIMLFLLFCFFISGQNEPFKLEDAGLLPEKRIVAPKVPTDLQDEAAATESAPAETHKTQPAGVVFVSIMQYLAERELDTVSGWTPNDILPPMSLLDNKQNFQLGVISVVQRSAFVLMENLSRSRTIDKINENAKTAFNLYSNEPTRWWQIPSYEGKVKNANRELTLYIEELRSGKASFYARADNLTQLNEKYASLLGSVTTALTEDDISYFETDDRYYNAKGVAYAMYIFYQAVQRDFGDVAAKNDASPLLQSIIDQLETAYFEPLIVMNGGQASIFANHLRNLASTLFNVRQKINSLNSVLRHQGSSSAG